MAIFNSRNKSLIKFLGFVLGIRLSYRSNRYLLKSCFQSINPLRPNPRRRKKIKLNFYFHTSLWCLKRFYEGLKGLHKTFWDTTHHKEVRKWKFNLIFISIQLSEMPGTGRVKKYEGGKDFFLAVEILDESLGVNC